MTIEQFNSLLGGKEIYEKMDNIVFGENYIIRTQQFLPKDEDGNETKNKIVLNSTAETLDCYLNGKLVCSGPISGIAWITYLQADPKQTNKILNNKVYNNYILA